MFSKIIQFWITLGLNGYSIYKNYNDNNIFNILKIFISVLFVSITTYLFMMSLFYTENDYRNDKVVRDKVDNHFNWIIFLVFNLIPIIEIFTQYL